MTIRIEDPTVTQPKFTNSKTGVFARFTLMVDVEWKIYSQSTMCFSIHWQTQLAEGEFTKDNYEGISSSIYQPLSQPYSREIDP